MATSGTEVAELDLAGTLEEGGKSGQRLSGDGNEVQTIGRSTTGQFSSTLSVASNGEMKASQTELELQVGNARTEVQLLSKIKAFQDQREEERRRMFHIVIRIGLRIVASAAVFIGIGTVLRFVLPGGYVPGLFITLGFSLFIGGVVLGSSCPYDLFDVDDVCQKNPKVMGAWIFGSGIVNVLQVRYFPHLDLVKLAFVLLKGVVLAIAGCGLRHPRWLPTISAAWAWYLSFDGISWAGIFFFYDQNDWLAIPETPSLVLSCINLMYGITAFVGWFWHRRRNPGLEHGDSVRFYKILYFWAVAFGIRWGLYGATWIISPREGSEDAVAGALEIARGLFTMLPSIGVMIVGRDRLFNALGHAFDKDGARLRRDGAFVAELLESIPVQEGQPWWIHREMENEEYPMFDPRRCWQKGVVTKVHNQSDFVIRVEERRSSGRRTSMRRSLISDSSNDALTVRMKLPTAGKGESKEDLLLRAQKDLRCVEFGNLSPDLMHRVDSRNKPELQAAWHALSRPVRPGEKIDYFMSNSWYDDPETKWERLVEVAETFHKRHGRYPTFWLDKLCIDQQKITDGLKVLPVNVMACTKLLALCGDTYLTRLWCIWELFTLFAFVSEAAALNRVEFVFLGTREAGMKMLDGMANFHVNTAHCYDPNEEARLLKVIDAVGTARFNAVVSKMASMTKERLVKQEKKRSSAGAGMFKATMSTTSGHSTASDKGCASDQIPGAPDGVAI